jgi:hypothetical protein
MSNTLATAERELEDVEKLVAHQIAALQDAKDQGLPTEAAVLVLIELRKRVLQAQRKHDFLMANLPPAN